MKGTYHPLNNIHVLEQYRQVVLNCVSFVQVRQGFNLDRLLTIAEFVATYWGCSQSVIIGRLIYVAGRGARLTPLSRNL